MTNSTDPITEITRADIEFQTHFMALEMQHEHEMQLALLKARTNLTTLLISRLPIGATIDAKVAEEITNTVDILLDIESADEEDSFDFTFTQDSTIN